MPLASCLALASLLLSGELDPATPYRARQLDPVTYEVDFRTVVTAPYGTKLLRVWIPIPPTDAAQTVTASSFETFPDRREPFIATEPVFGNTFAYFEFSNPQGAQVLTHRFTITTHELRFDVDATHVDKVAAWPDSFRPFLRSESQAVVVSDAVRATANQIVPAPALEPSDLQKVLGWIDANLSYSHSHASLQASSQWALAEKTGHCSDYHGLCAALTRALGYPARITYGINAMPKNSPSHCKAEVFLPGYGWVSFDISETQKLCAKITADSTLPEARKAQLIAAAKKRLLSGFRDNTWYLQTRGTDYDLAPPAGRRVAVVRTAYVEADGIALPEPDPADPSKREYAWMTAHSFRPDRAITYPFASWKSLEQEAGPQ